MTNDILSSFLGGQQAGQQQRTKRTLADFLQPAIGGDQNALAKVYSADPNTGLQVQGMVQQQAGADREQKLEQLELTSRAWRAATPEMRQQLYPSVVELTESVLPQFAGKIPREYSPAYEANIDKFLSGFAGQEEQFTLSPGSARYGADGRLLVSQPFAPEKPQFQTDADGNGWWIAPGQAPRPVDGGSSLGPAIANPATRGFDSLHASIPGLRVTSGTRTPEQNAAAGGVANSFHRTGQAIDIGTPSPEQRAKINQWAAQNEYEVIDNYKDGHVHLEPKGRPSAAGIKFPTKGNASTDDKAANWQIVQGQDGTFYRVNKLTGETVSSGVQGANALRAQDQHQKRAEAVAGVEGAIRSTDETLKSLELLITHPGRGSGTGLSSVLPSIPGTDRKNFDAQLATFKAQTFIPMVSQLKGMGALSDAEGKKLMDAVGALDPAMGEQAFGNSLNRIKAQLLRAQAAAYGKISDLRRNQSPTESPNSVAPTSQFSGFRVLD